MTKKIVDEISYNIIGAAIEVHKDIGPGLLETVYHECLLHELTSRNLSVASEQSVPVVYKGLRLHTTLRCDLIVNNLIVVELKSVETMAPLFTAQLMTYLNLLQLPKGILINFNCLNIFQYGQKTIVNELYRRLPP